MRIIHIGSTRLSFKTKLIIGLAIAITFALLAVLAVAVIGILLVLVPALLVAGMVYALLPGRRTARPPQSANQDILEGQYRIIDGNKDGD